MHPTRLRRGLQAARRREDLKQDVQDAIRVEHEDQFVH